MFIAAINAMVFHHNVMALGSESNELGFANIVQKMNVYERAS